MKTVKKILVPTDFSENAEAAFDMARTLADTFDARITVVHARQVPLVPVAYAFGPMEFPAGVEEDIKKAVDNSLEAARKALGTERVEDVRVLDGTPFLEINRIAEAENFDMIVMATHGHTGLGHLLMGSNAEKVVRTAPCAVVTVRPKES